MIANGAAPFDFRPKITFSSASTTTERDKHDKHAHKHNAPLFPVVIAAHSGRVLLVTLLSYHVAISSEQTLVRKGFAKKGKTPKQTFDELRGWESRTVEKLPGGIIAEIFFWQKEMKFF